MIQKNKDRLFFAFLSVIPAFLFAWRWKEAFPFCSKLINPTYETYASLGAYFTYLREPFQFPLGKIAGLGFPLESVNVGTTGGIPLFAVIFKAVAKFIPSLQNFNFFPFFEILSVFLSTLFVILILKRFRVGSKLVYVVAALTISLSHALIVKSLWGNYFDVVAFPLYLAWIYFMSFLQRSSSRTVNVALCFLLPIAVLTDFYSFVGLSIMTGTVVLALMFLSVIHRDRVTTRLAVGSAASFLVAIFLSVFSLFVIGLFPLPQAHFKFSTFEFGMGGRYHVADIMALWIAQADGVAGMIGSALINRFGYPLTTQVLSTGQIIGVAFVGTAGLVLVLLAGWFLFATRKKLKIQFRFFVSRFLTSTELLPNWIFISIGIFAVTVFSLGYSIHFLGRPLEAIPLTPAGLLSEIFPPLLSIRAPGRLIIPLLLSVLLGSCILVDRLLFRYEARPGKSFVLGLLAVLSGLHLVEVMPLLTSSKTQSIESFPTVFSEVNTEKIVKFTNGIQTLLFAPSVRSVDREWVREAHALAIAVKKKSNIFYTARYTEVEDEILNKDIHAILLGQLSSVIQRYGSVCFVLRKDVASEVLSRSDVPLETMGVEDFVIAKPRLK